MRKKSVTNYKLRNFSFKISKLIVKYGKLVDQNKERAKDNRIIFLGHGLTSPTGPPFLRKIVDLFIIRSLTVLPQMLRFGQKESGEKSKEAAKERKREKESTAVPFAVTSCRGS